MCSPCPAPLRAVPAPALSARLGSDQFAVVLPDIHNRGDAARVADRLLADMRAVFHIEGTPLSLSPSIGIAVFPETARAPTS